MEKRGRGRQGRQVLRFPEAIFSWAASAESGACFAWLRAKEAICCATLCRHVGVKGQGTMGSLTVRAGKGL